MTDPKRPRGLGRGLGALLPGGGGGSPSSSSSYGGGGSGAPGHVAEAAAVVAPDPRGRAYFHAGIEDVYPGPEQPRRRFDEVELEELAASIRAHGVIMPLVVRPRPGGGYHLIAGERRWRAAQRAGLHEVPVVVQDVDGREAFERALVENLQRSDLNPIEEAAAFQRLIEEFGLTQDEVAVRVGKDRSTIANSVRLLRLPDGVRVMVEDRKLTMGHARALLGLESVDDMETVARAVGAKGLSVRATEELVRKRVRPPADASKAAAERAPRSSKSASVRDLEERMTKALGGPVTITEDAPGKAGSIEIRYMDLDHLDRLLERLL